VTVTFEQDANRSAACVDFGVSKHKESMAMFDLPIALNRENCLSELSVVFTRLEPPSPQRVVPSFSARLFIFTK
jgi:hypothetical protein